MKTLKKIRRWLKNLKEDMEKNSVSNMKSSDKLPCCSKPIGQVAKKGN